MLYLKTVVLRCIIYNTVVTDGKLVIVIMMQKCNAIWNTDVFLNSGKRINTQCLINIRQCTPATMLPPIRYILQPYTDHVLSEKIPSGHFNRTLIT